MIYFRFPDNKCRLITIHLQSLFNLLLLTTETSNDLRTLRDHTNKAIQALSNLDCATEHWDDRLIFLVAQKLDKLRKTWELKLGDTIDYPRYREFDQFLASRIRAFDVIAPANATEKSQMTSKRKTLASYTAFTIPFSDHYAKRIIFF